MAKPLITEEEISALSIINGNLDVDRYISELDDVQRRIINEDLGDDLYEKICEDYSVNTLTGIYLVIYDKYIKWMLIYKAMEQYISLGGVNIANNGITRPSSENNAPLFESEIGKLSHKFKIRYEGYKDNLYKYLESNQLSIPEWKNNGYNNYNDLGGFLVRKRR